MMNRNKQQSFTLIELLVVIVIIGILAGVIVVSTNNNVSKAQDTKTINSILSINKLLKTYSLDSFPIENTPCNVRTSCTNLKSKIEIPDIDQDIYYKTSSSGKFFVIYANKPSDISLSFEINSTIEKVKEVPSFNNLVAYYPLSIGTSDGTAISDMSLNANHDTNYGATFAEGSDGNVGTGMKFDGVDDYINLGNFNLTGDKNSVSIWINSSNTPSTEYDKRFFSMNYFDIKFASGNLESWIYDTSFKTLIYPASNLDANTWYHVVVTIGSNDLKLYVDGILRSQNTTFSLTSHPYNLNIGSTYSGDSRFFNGVISNVRIYKKALSENEIKMLYNNKN